MRKLKGIIVSNKMQKTVVVRIDSLKKHPKYQKFYQTSQKYKVHDEKGEGKIGDVVMIEETRPLSKEKRWKISTIIQKASSVEGNIEEKVES